MNQNVVYFIGDDTTHEIKIGMTRSLAKRVKELENNNGRIQPHTFLAAIRGERVHEQSLHRHFSHIRTAGEYFEATYELEDYIRWLRAQTFVVRQVGDYAQNVDFSEWMPTADRRIVLSQPRLTELDTWQHLLEDLPITGDDYYTNEIIITAALEVCGHFDLDPASHPIANGRFIRAKQIYTIHDNGLLHEWAGNVWCNPPFNVWHEWTPKIMSEWKRGEIVNLFVLMATRSTSAKSNAALFNTCHGLCITNGRIPFWGPMATPSPDDGHIIAYFGPHIEQFIESFKRVGSVFCNPTAADLDDF